MKEARSAGSIAMSYIQSGTAAGQFLSVYVTARNTSTPTGTMETPVLVWRLIRPPRLAREHRASALGKATTALQFATLFGVVLGLGHVVPLIGAALVGVAAGTAYAIDELTDVGHRARRTT